MLSEKDYPELKRLVEKALMHRFKSEEYVEHIIDYLKEMGYINEDLITNIVSELILNTNSPKSSSEFIEDIFNNLNVEGNF